MLDITKLLSGEVEHHSMRYSQDCSDTKTGIRKGFGPVIAWNITQKCNYYCKHCYSNASCEEDVDTLNFGEITKIIDDFEANNVPVILLSGGEPLIRNDIFDIIRYIAGKKIRISLSTNGSLIDKSTAAALKGMGISYVGISIDGTREKNDDFRGVSGAFDNTIKAIENCYHAGQKVGLRFTLQKNNYKDVPSILELMEEMKVDRICFYHLVPSGRGKDITDQMLSNEETKEVIDYLYEYSKKMIAEKKNTKEILTVANHTDGPYIYQKVKKEDPYLAEKILNMLIRNKGNRSGTAIANVDWNGTVYPDQFTRFLPIGNLKSNSFSTIWNDNQSILWQLRNRNIFLEGRCSACKWLSICNGNLRARAYHVHGDMWAPDPACYLEDDEI
ncbi:MAG: radical SAM protein [Bacillota bacterium]